MKRSIQRSTNPTHFHHTLVHLAEKGFSRGIPTAPPMCTHTPREHEVFGGMRDDPPWIQCQGKIIGVASCERAVGAQKRITTLEPAG